MKEIEKAARIIQEGGLVAFPTETVYGLGADALNPMAVARIFEVKRRPQFDPLIVHIADLRQAEILVKRLPSQAVKLAEVFWPGPLTLVLEKSPMIPDLVTSSLSTVAIRVPDHPLALDLIRESGRPLAAPSANPFGGVSPTTAEHVWHSLGNKVDLILDGGPCRVGVESTVLSLVGDIPVLLRPGGVSLEELQALLGEVALSKDGPLPQAPGQLSSHYSPSTPLRFLDRIPSSPLPGKWGLLSFQTHPEAGSFAAAEVLSPGGNLREAAANLFSSIHKLDSMGLDGILALSVPGEGLGRAINDRLKRAGGSKNRD
jgi:L-threonylcarbamoyladenylate synthase